ncbi:MAG: rod shape-determining protein MreC [Deltaproteobacteria bacterium]|nr:rod shape-determining protein MreC [Deltaproteobacteria bacterium]
MQRFFYQYRVTLSCIFFLASSLFLAMVNIRAPYRIDPVGVLVLEVMYIPQLAVTWVGDYVGQAWNHYVALWSLREENAELRKKIESLEKSARHATEVYSANQRLSELLTLREDIGGTAVAARIVGRSPLAWVKTAVLDRGTSHGVTKGMSVLVSSGVVGQVMSASAHTSRVLLVSDLSSAVDILVQRTRTRGIVSGAADGGCTLKYLERKEDVQIGDTLVTSGLDGIFPKGQLLGTVTRVGAQGGHLFQEVEVKLSADLSKVEEVLVSRPLLTADGR